MTDTDEQPLQIQDPESQTRGLEKIKFAADKLKMHKKNAVFQTKRIYTCEMFIGFNQKNLIEAQKQVDYFTERIKVNIDDLAFAKKSIEFSTTYVYEHGDDEDKQKFSESLLKKMKLLKKQMAALEEQYKTELAKEQKPNEST